MSEEMRKVFEKWAEGYGLQVFRVHKNDPSEPDGVGDLEEGYPRLDVQTAWASWQAAWGHRLTQTDIAKLREALITIQNSLAILDNQFFSIAQDVILKLAREARLEAVEALATLGEG